MLFTVYIDETFMNIDLFQALIEFEGIGVIFAAHFF
jgi:hypothetical protein